MSSTAVAVPAPRTLRGLILGSLGVLVFSFTFPAGKFALRELDPWEIAFGRAVIAGALALPTLALLGARRPTRREAVRLLIVAAGVVVGFPTLSTLALQETSSSHSAVVNGILPAATAVAAVVRTGERPSLRFWLAALAGAALVTGYAIWHAGGTLEAGDLYLLGAVAVCAIGYAEGGLLSRTLGAPETICWALVLSLPLTVPVTLANLPAELPSWKPLAGLVYLGVGSMFLGFFAWYAGLAAGGLARVSQVQLAQTPLALVWSALLLGETVGWEIVAVALGAVLAVAATQRARVRPAAT